MSAGLPLAAEAGTNTGARTLTIILFLLFVAAPNPSASVIR